jgi:uncharacterized tellurite resistance protein B-like protein
MAKSLGQPGSTRHDIHPQPCGPHAPCDHARIVIKTLKDLFDRLLPPLPDAAPQSVEHLLQLATAVMLVEVMRADASFHPDERRAVLAALREKFDLADDEAQRLADLAEATARDATDLYAFTSRINERFEMPQKLRMVEHMWRVAYADGHLSEHERHVLWRVADLLHVPKGAYVHARMRAEQAAMAPGGDSGRDRRAGEGDRDDPLDRQT